MSDLAMWSLIVGFFLPIAVAVIMRRTWSDAVKAVVTFVACGVAAAGTAFFQGDFTGRRFVSALLLVFVGTIVSFKGWWKPTGVAPSIEESTSP